MLTNFTATERKLSNTILLIDQEEVSVAKNKCFFNYYSCILLLYWGQFDRRFYLEILYFLNHVWFVINRLSWPWSYGSWIYNYLCTQCLSPLMLWVCQWLATGRWFSLGPLVSSTKKKNRHDVVEILLKVALNTIKQTYKNQCGIFSISL